MVNLRNGIGMGAEAQERGGEKILVSSFHPPIHAPVHAPPLPCAQESMRMIMPFLTCIGRSGGWSGGDQIRVWSAARLVFGGNVHSGSALPPYLHPAEYIFN